MPAESDRKVFALAPAVVVLSTFLVFLVIPTGPRLVVKDLDVGVFYALAVSSLSVIGVLMAGSLNLQGIVLAQPIGSIFGVDLIGNPYIFTQFIGFFLFLVAAQAEL